ncbi:MAG: outer membrane lipoprotein carrier protein LolA [Bacteroidetes bacterium]|nr:outer membrane lipoprotein carrier protein LolA [Bacteroidota bacterium]NCQ11819.1 outer membrane lipoprotein carrier protein LolA [Bacteroidota bacterium]
MRFYAIWINHLIILICLITAPAMGFQTVKPTNGLENLKAKLKSGQVFQATITHSLIDTFTNDTLYTVGKIWIYQDGYRLESENRIISVNDSISQVYNSIKEQLIISPYVAIDDDFAPSRFIQASETDFNIVEKAINDSTQWFIKLESKEDFSLFTTIELTLDEWFGPKSVNANDQNGNINTTLFTNAIWQDYDKKIQEIDYPDSTEIIDLRE